MINGSRVQVYSCLDSRLYIVTVSLQLRLCVYLQMWTYRSRTTRTTPTTTSWLTSWSTMRCSRNSSVPRSSSTRVSNPRNTRHFAANSPWTRNCTSLTCPHHVNYSALQVGLIHVMFLTVQRNANHARIRHMWLFDLWPFTPRYKDRNIVGH